MTDKQPKIRITREAYRMLKGLSDRSGTPISKIACDCIYKVVPHINKYGAVIGKHVIKPVGQTVEDEDEAAL